MPVRYYASRVDLLLQLRRPADADAAAKAALAKYPADSEAYLLVSEQYRKHGHIQKADVMLERGYSDGRAYAQSKLAQVMFTFDLARELEGSGVSVNTLHPATYMDTNMVMSRGVRPASSVEDGAEAVVNLITSEDVGSGQFFNGLRPARANAQAYDEAARERLSRLSRELTGAP